MRRMSHKAPAFLIAAMTTVLLAQPVLATGPQVGRGTFANTAFTSPPTSRLADGNFFFEEHLMGVIDGTIEGARTLVVTGVVHPDSTLNFNGTETCVCTVDGRSGSFVDRFEGTGSGLTFTGSLTVLRGTGDLRDLHAVATFTGAINPATGLGAASYSVDYRFDP